MHIHGWEEIIAAAEESEDSPVTGTVTEVIKGGLIVVTEWHPRLCAGFSGDCFEKRSAWRISCIRKSNFVLSRLTVRRRRAVGSIRSVLRDERKALAEKFWETVEEWQGSTPAR